MTSMDMGFEAALNVGLPPPAVAGPAGSDATANRGAMFRADRAQDARSACFKTALRAAAQKDKTDAAVSPPSPQTSASAVSSEGEPAPEADSLKCGDMDGETKSTEPPAETQTRESIEAVCGQWVEPLQAASPGEGSACNAVEGTDDAADGQAAEAAIPKESAELLDLLRRLQESLAGNSADAVVLVRQVAERIEQYQTSMGGGVAPRTGEIEADLLSQLRDALAEAAPEPSIAGDGGSAAQALKAASETEDHAPAGKEADGVRRTIEAADILPAARRVLAQLREADPALPNSAAATDGDGEAPAAPAGTAAGLTALSGTADAAAGYASAQRATPRPEIVRKGVEPESHRLAGAEHERSASVAETRFESSAESGDFRQSADGALYSKTPATQTPATGEGESLPDAAAVTARETHPSPATESGLEKTADGPSVSRDKEAMTGTGRAGIFDQIVQRAAVQLKNDQGEINIDLKPDFLGRVRMQILTENQQVTVRIVTELATVRDMIETGLNQLKSELQSQGLQVERLEVAVADDHRQRGWQQANTAPAWKSAAGGDVSALERPDIEERSASLYYRPRSSGTASIDMFV